jgi:hypothetical protein
MSRGSTRRRFLQSALTGGAALSGSSLPFLGNLPLLSADSTRLPDGVVALRPEIEPLVRFLEVTPREDLLEKVAQRLGAGLSYRELLAALFLAGVRNVQPRPYVGFKFHAVLVVNAAHLASLSSPPADRWLPIFWALDYFKSAQATDIKEGNWTMVPVKESRVPSATRARDAFRQAMESWDVEAADAAIAGLVRTAGANEIFELFFRYGARDYRSIGHKAIFVAASMRTLETIGWQHAEPVLRSLAYALLNHDGPNPAQSDAPADRPWRRHLEMVNKIPAAWRSGKASAATSKLAMSEFLEVLRHGTEDAPADSVVDLLGRGIGPRPIWDALLMSAGELLMRSPGIVSLHAVTTTNALHQAYLRSGDDVTRRLLLLQNAAFLPLFRATLRGREATIADIHLDEFGQGDDSAPAAGAGAALPSLDEIFHDVGEDPAQAAAKTLRYLQNGGSARSFMDTARVLIFRKGFDSHDYKFSSAVLEDYAHISPAWRDRYLAASVFRLRGSTERENPLVARVRQAFAG